MTCVAFPRAEGSCRGRVWLATRELSLRCPREGVCESCVRVWACVGVRVCCVCVFTAQANQPTAASKTGASGSRVGRMMDVESLKCRRMQ